MIKKILLSLGLIGFGLISFTNGQFIEIGETTSIINSSPNYGIEVPILNGLTDIGNFYNRAIVTLWNLYDYGNYGHQLFFHDNKIYFNHSLNNNNTNIQGYLTNWKICNLSGNDYDNASKVNCQGNFDTPINLDDINQVDSIYLNNWYIYHVDQTSYLCLIDKSQNKSFCVSCHYMNCPSGYTPGNLINSSNYYDENAFYELGEDIFSGGGGGNSIISGGQSPISGGYSYMNCTNQNVLAYYVKRFGYNGNMCNLESGGVLDGYYPYGTLKEFCNIYYTFYNIDGTFLNQLYTGHNKNIVCDSPASYLTGDYPASIDWSGEFPGVVNGSGEYEVQSSDSFLINLTNILKGNFYLPESGDFGLGYLPRYIILGFMGVIFFNFIRK